MSDLQQSEAVEPAFPLDFNFLYGKPKSQGIYKQRCEDFVVKEALGFELTGEGEHVCLWIQKIGENTQYLARQLAKFAAIPARNVSYAGLKDRQGDTWQWFSLHIPGKITPDFSLFESPGVTIHKVIRHHKKIKTGALAGNYFSITLRDISDKEAFQVALLNIKHGVPNYFGEQRFGHGGHNVSAALTMFEGRKIKDRFKRGMYLSAARSYLFNHLVSQRISDNLYQQPMQGDCVQFVGNRSFFTLPDLEPDTIHRLQSREVCLTAPLWGAGELASQSDAKIYETDKLQCFESLQRGLAKNGLKQERRPLLLVADKLSSTWIDEQTARIDFYLPSGCYATSILRELIQ
ncbi:tRNA pseudouridine(13) synthase TruD [Psychromonas sp. psych-6C06]|uniref:tRNA pseudouridine(13) synthase TruD n=1 Tax=Psychromonas sp. psych-6C06 TaxID=2058089 RepID=UPI000C32D738|nr:tRNA pseudouridine(13) synthase TruD [Psychromonas sp. psych-6C06]PKF61999.1 tRNA pseudouridine(13) synthase TruD [Psychromonas sp. psych-6C06]